MPAIINPSVQQTRAFTSPMEAAEAFKKSIDEGAQREMAKRQAKAELLWKQLDYIDKSSPGGLKGAFSTNPYVGNLIGEAIRASGYAADKPYSDADVEAMMGGMVGGLMKGEDLLALAQAQGLTDFARGATSGAAGAPSAAATGPSSSAEGAASTPSSTPVMASPELKAPGVEASRAQDLRSPGYPPVPGQTQGGAAVTPLPSGVGAGFLPQGGQGASLQYLASQLSPFAMGTATPAGAVPTGYTPPETTYKTVPKYSETPAVAGTPDPTAVRRYGKAVTPAMEKLGLVDGSPSTSIGRANGLSDATMGAALSPKAFLDNFDKAVATTGFASKEDAEAVLYRLRTGKSLGKGDDSAAGSIVKETFGDLATKTADVEKSKIMAVGAPKVADLAADLEVVELPAGGWGLRLRSAGGSSAKTTVGSEVVPVEGAARWASMSTPGAGPGPTPETAPRAQPIPEIPAKALTPVPPPGDTSKERASFFKAYSRNADIIGKVASAGSYMSPETLSGLAAWASKADPKELAAMGLSGMLDTRGKAAEVALAESRVTPEALARTAKLEEAKALSIELETAKLKAEMDALPETMRLEKEKLALEFEKLKGDAADAAYKREYLTYLKNQLAVDKMKAMGKGEAEYRKLVDGAFSSVSAGYQKYLDDATKGKPSTPPMTYAEFLYKAQHNEGNALGYVSKLDVDTLAAMGYTPIMTESPKAGGVFGTGIGTWIFPSWVEKTYTLPGAVGTTPSAPAAAPAASAASKSAGESYYSSLVGGP